MNEETDNLAEMWNIVKEYIGKKDLQHCADHVISTLLDNGLEPEDLKCLAECDTTMEASLDEYADDEDPDVDDEE